MGVESTEILSAQSSTNGDDPGSIAASRLTDCGLPANGFLTIPACKHVVFYAHGSKTKLMISEFLNTMPQRSDFYVMIRHQMRIEMVFFGSIGSCLII